VTDRPTPAPAHFPYDHPNMAEVMRAECIAALKAGESTTRAAILSGCTLRQAETLRDLMENLHVQSNRR
jgi:hypothetical protein